MKTTLYLHSTKDHMYYLADKLGLSEEATRKFVYALYEVEFEVDVDETTGEVVIDNILYEGNIYN